MTVQGATDHRRAERYSVQLPARVRPAFDGDEDSALDLVTSDVCSGGAYFQTDTPLPIGTEVKIDMVLPLERLKKIKGKMVRIRVSGAVIRASQEGMAISFKDDYVISPWS